MTTSTRKLREQILREHGLAPRHKKSSPTTALSYDELSVDFHKTPLMHYIEEHFGVTLKVDIYKGSLNEVCSRYNWEVNRSTVSRWRRYIRRYLINHPEKKETVS